MELSPLQLQQLLFTKIHVEPTADLDQVEELWAPGYDFSGINIKVDVTVGTNTADEARDYLVAVRLVLADDAQVDKKVPYNVDVEAKARFSLAEGFVVQDPEAAVRVNGGSLVVGAIRDMIQQLTARSLFGPMLIPTLRFLP